MIDVSVVVPVFNVEQYLKRTIGSLLNQTIIKYMELILVDDGSMDRSGKICDELAGQYSNIVVIHQQNCGVSAARNAGILSARGAYIGFVDGDDYVEPNMYELLYNNIIQESAGISCVGYSIRRRSGMYVKRYDTKKRYVWSREEALYEMLSEKKFDFLCIDKLYRRDLILDHLFNPSIAIGEDRQFVYENINACNRIVYEDICCYVYERRSGSAMVSMFNDRFIINYDIASQMCADVKKAYPNLRRVADCHLIRTVYKTLEKLEQDETAKITYLELRNQLYSRIHSFKLFDALGILSIRHLFALLLMKYYPALYLKLCKLLDV